MKIHSNLHTEAVKPKCVSSLCRWIRRTVQQI